MRDEIKSERLLSTHSIDQAVTSSDIAFCRIDFLSNPSDVHCDASSAITHCDDTLDIKDLIGGLKNKLRTSKQKMFKNIFHSNKIL